MVYGAEKVQAMNEIDNLIAAGKVLLLAARKLEEEGNTYDSRILYVRALRQGLRIREKRCEAMPTSVSESMLASNC